MDTIRLFLRSNSLRLSKRKTSSTSKSSPNEFTQDEPNDSLDNEDNHSSSSDKIKPFITHSASSSLLPHLSVCQLDFESCSGLSTPSSDLGRSALVVASASESISNALSFTDNHSSKRRRSSHGNDKRRRSWVTEQNIHHTSQPFRRTKSHRPPDRIKRHSIKSKQQHKPSEVNNQVDIHIL